MTMKPSHIRKAIFPIGGTGTRFLPLTLAMPKEMIPVVDTPLLHFCVLEAIEAGCEECIFVISDEYNQRNIIENYFSNNGVLERRLRAAGKSEQAEKWRAKLPTPDTLHFVEQKHPLGLGNAIWLSREIIGDESFAVLLPDELLFAKPGCLSSLVSAYRKQKNGFLVAMQQVEQEECHRYGILNVGDGKVADEPVELYGVIEKPAPGSAPSNFAIIGRYILPADVFKLLQPSEKVEEGKEDTPLTDALEVLIKSSVSSRAMLFNGERYDCGSKEGFLAAILARSKGAL
ncbi:MAG: sugar phosphate nucleotidyltransferase [Hyphomicrobiales bacterium]|nr:sugar phosphate nucleotidyltransferase [Hyphomicrobiales bacterium]MCY4049836.1 sugar phosphate nucleotidyltransferase [Hyphomicrobiales bacterium]